MKGESELRSPDGRRRLRALAISHQRSAEPLWLAAVVDMLMWARRTTTVRVYHDYLGCETGCCGHMIELDTPGDRTDRDSFEVGQHPETKAEAMELVRAVITERWPECLPTIDWSSFEFVPGDC